MPVVMPVDNAEMRRVNMQYTLVKLVAGDNHYEEINELLNPPYDASIRVLDVISNSPCCVLFPFSEPCQIFA